MAITDISNCGELACELASKLSTDQIMKLLVTDDGNGCLALKTKGTTGGGGGGGYVPAAKVPSIIYDATTTVATNLPINCVSYSILFQGIGGQLNGNPVADGASFSIGNGFDTIAGPALTYLRPASGSVIISKLT